MAKRKRSSFANFSIHKHKEHAVPENANLPEPEYRLSTTTFTDLPVAVITDILLRLGVRSVLICSCVCKTLHTLVSSSDFNKMYFKSATEILMIRTCNPSRVSRQLYPLKFDPDFFVADEKCYCEILPETDCKSQLILKPMFKLPLRDAKMVVDGALESGRQGKYVACKPRDDKFGVVNSCNGLICLCNPKGDPMVVCNPITGDYIKLPEGNKEEKGRFYSGFGFNSKSKEYVVIRAYRRYTRSTSMSRYKRYVATVAEMHTLGTSYWCSIGDIPDSNKGLGSPTCVHGVICWLRNHSLQLSIVCFDFESEEFQEIPFPPVYGHLDLTSIGTLEGLLSLCVVSPKSNLQLWVMREFGAQESWVKLTPDNCAPCSHGLYRPLTMSNTSGLVTFNSKKSCFLYHDLKTEHGFKYLRMGGDSKGTYEAFALAEPNLEPLKKVLNGRNVEIVNVNSRCGLLKLHEDGVVPFLAEDSAKSQT